MQLSDTETRLSQRNRQLVLWEVSCVFVLRLFPSLYGRLGGGVWSRGANVCFISSSSVGGNAGQEVAPYFCFIVFQKGSCLVWTNNAKQA